MRTQEEWFGYSKGYFNQVIDIIGNILSKKVVKCGNKGKYVVKISE